MRRLQPHTGLPNPAPIGRTGWTDQCDVSARADCTVAICLNQRIHDCLDVLGQWARDSWAAGHLGYTLTLEAPCIRCILSVTITLAAATAPALDLTGATIVPSSPDGVIMKAAIMLQEELAERSGVTLAIAESAPATGPVIHLGTVESVAGVKVPEAAEAYGIAVSGNTVKLVGRDERGALFAAGRLIRLADYAPGALSLELKKPIATAPDVAVRAPDGVP